MNTQSVDCIRRSGEAFPDRLLAPGEFAWSAETDDGTRALYIVLPADSKPRPYTLIVRRGSPGGHLVWGWDGNEGKPTVEPSINAPGQWHGFLRAGRLQSC